MRYFLTLFSVVYLIIGNPLVAQEKISGLPYHKYFTTQDYQGGIQNWAIAQNMQGLIYVANNFGVLEFDGTNWNRYPLLSGTKVRDIAISSDGKIYAACQGDFGYLFPNERGALQFTSLADSLPTTYRGFDETWKIFKSGDDIIFCTFQQIFIYNNGGEIEVIDPEFAPENFFQVNNILYVNQLEVGLAYLDQSELKVVQGAEVFKGKTINSIVQLTKNELLIATLNDGIYLNDGKVTRRWMPEHRDKFVKNSIMCMIPLRNGDFAIGTQGDGLFLIDRAGNIKQHLTKGKGLNNRSILSLFEDNLGNLWVGHNNGLAYIELSLPFTFIDEQINLPGTGYSAHLTNNQLYLGTNNGLFVKDLTTGILNDYKLVKDTEGQVYEVEEVDKDLLIGHHRGAYKVSDDQASQLSSTLGAWTYLVLKNNPNFMIEGTYKGLLLYERANNEWVFRHEIKGFDESSRVLEEDNEGNIWMTHGYKGVFKIKLNESMDSVSQISFYGEESGLPSNILINVFNIRNQLIFTTESQIYRYDKATDQFVVDEFFASYFDESYRIMEMAEDDLQNIYYMGPQEIGILRKDASGQYNKESETLNKIRYLVNDDLQNISVISPQQVLFGAKEGFIVYNDRLNAKIDDQHFNTPIREVRLTGKSDSAVFLGHFLHGNNVSASQPESAIFEFPFSHNSFKFNFSAPFLDGINPTEYSFRLEGYEESYSPWTQNTEKEYTNLVEGEYTFHVKAQNGYGISASEATYTFIILSPWYRSNWAYIIFALAILGSLLVAFKWMDRKHKKEKKVLHREREQEIIKKEEELKNLDEQRKNELQLLKNEKLKSEIKHKNKELATSTMHLINKNEFITGIKNNLGNLAKISVNAEVRKELKNIAHTIEKNISQDNDWEHFEIHFDQVHGDFSQRLKNEYPKLTAQEMKLSAYLRMNLSTKEIAHLLNISVRGVEISRYRLRKKLGLDRQTNLADFILKF